MLLPVLALALALALAACARSMHVPLEMSQPRRNVPGTRWGFPPVVRIHEPDAELGWVARYHNVELFGGMVAVGEYYAKVEIGGQVLRVQIDTGSATLAVPVAECSNCRSGDMRYNVAKSKGGVGRLLGCDDVECMEGTCSNLGCGACSEGKNACCAHSDTSKCAFHLNFGDGSGAKGLLVRDNLKWGDVEFPVTFGGIRSDSPDFERQQVDGILGMAYPSLACNPSCITPTFESMLKTVKMKNLFTICITYDSGRIVLGEYDPSFGKNPISWVPLQLSSEPSFYTVKLLGNLQVDGKDLALPSYTKAIVDSGTTLIVFSHATFDAFKNHLMKEYCHIPELCGSDSWFKPAHCVKIEESDRLKMPTLRFRLDGFNVDLGPSEYLINYASKGRDYWCVGLMALDSMSGGIDVIFGNTVMKKYVTIYDRENHRVGFTESTGACAGNGTKDVHSLPHADAPSKLGPPDSGPVFDDPNFNDGGKSNGTASPAPGVSNTGTGNSLSAGSEATCDAAKDCKACRAISAKSVCFWDTPLGQCVPGEATKLMCVIDSFAGKFAYLVGGAVVGVVVIAGLLAVVHSYRKRQNARSEAHMDQGELEEQRAPLAAAGDDARRNEFAVGDSDDDREDEF